MKWMGWGLADLEEADPDMVREIINMINEEREEYERMAAERE